MVDSLDVLPCCRGSDYCVRLISPILSLSLFSSHVSARPCASCHGTIGQYGKNFHLKLLKTCRPPWRLRIRPRHQGTTSYDRGGREGSSRSRHSRQGSSSEPSSLEAGLALFVECSSSLLLHLLLLLLPPQNLARQYPAGKSSSNLLCIRKIKGSSSPSSARG